MNITGLICVLLAQYLSGSGILRLFRLQLAAIPAFCLSMVLGVAIMSFVPCVLQLMHIPITDTNTAIGLAITTVLCAIPLVVFFRKPQFGKIDLPKIYEVPFIIVFLFFIGTSVFRCYYFPPTPRDVLAGGELLAEFTIREKTMVNSVFGIDLHTTNNYFKSPFLTSLQIIYKLFVCPFGQVWLSTLYVSLVVWLYTILKSRLHALVACFLLMLFLAIPDAFAYSYIILYDYSNMVFYFAGFYFIMQHLQHKRDNDFAFSVLLFGIATYIRVETLVLVAMIALLPAFYAFKEKMPLQKIAIRAAILMSGPVLFYLICMKVFIPAFVPFTLDTSTQINQNMLDISTFFTRISAINDVLIFSDKGVLVYGYYLYYFMALVVCDLVFIRKFNQEARMALYGIAVVYFGLAFLGYLLPLFDVLNTTKRGMFKVIPLILMYFANSGIVLKLSDYLTYRENRVKDPVAPRPAVATAAARAKPKVKVK